MSNLLAELQAKQKLRAASLSVSPQQAAAISASASSAGPTPTPHHVGASGHAVPPPRAVPPPPPPKSQSVILPGPPLAGADGASAPLPRGIPAGAVPLMPVPSEHSTRPVPPPIPSRAGPPPLPPGSSRPTPPPLPSSHHPSPPPASSSSSASDAQQTPTAPDTPAGSRHRTSGSFSSTLAPPSFSPIAGSPLSPPPPSMPLPPMPHAMTGASSGAPNRPAQPPPPPKRVVVPDANRTLYLNDYAAAGAEGADDDSTDAADPPEFRLDMSGSAIKLSKTVKVYSERQENRFLDDFVPTIPPGADSLVASSLTAFNRPIKAFLRTHVKYHKIVNPNAAPAGTVLSPKAAAAKDTALVEFECDEPFRASASGDGAAAGSSASSGKKKKDGLADLFNQPGVTSPPPAAPPAAERNASEGSVTLAQQQADEAARQAEIDSLVNLNLLHMTPALASAAVHADDAVFARKEENLFLRSHPSFEYNEMQHKAEFTICKRMPTSAATAMWSRDPGTQFLTSVHALRIGIGNVEPFFGTLALYDLKSGVRLTEDFHFDLNDNSLLTGQLEVNKSCADPITLCGHALFSCQDKHDAVYMVVKLERILQGDPAELEHYFKPKLRTPAEMAAMVKKTRNNLIYLSDYRQPFGWGMIPMFEETGELKNWAAMAGGSGAHERGPNYVRFDKIFAQMDSLKDDLFIQLLRETRESSSKGGKVYPGTYFDLRIEEMNENELPANRVDVSCIALKNTENTKNVEEIAEYNVAADTALPTGPGSSSGSARPSISIVPMVPSTPMAATPQTPSGSGAGAPPTPSSGHPGHQSQPSMTGIALQLPGAASSASSSSSADKALLAPPHSTPFSNNPIPNPPLIREIEEFTDYSPPLGALANNGGMVPPTPHTFFVNMMYVYPEFIKFEKFRNIACRVQLRTNDQNPVGEGMKVIRGRSSGSNFTTSALTQVNYHRKQLTPQEEVACVLPLSLNASTHLFFTFYKVSCKTDPGKREVIGMACLPLSQKGRVLVDDVYQLPIAAKLPKNYLQPYADGKETDELHFRHSGAKCFSVRLKLVSSIFSQDEPIYSFLQQFPNAKELIASGGHHGRDLLHKAVENIHRINPWYTVKFLPPLLDYMFELIQNRATPSLPGNNANQIQASYYAFLGLTYLVYRISEYYVHEGVHGHSGNRCSILVAYITHRLENLQTPSVMMQAGTAAIPNALGVEAGPAATAAGATPTSSVTYTPLYAVFAKLWLVGLNPSATSDNAALFTLPSTAAASSSSASAAASLSSPQMGGSAAGSGGNPGPSPSSAASGLTSPPAGSPTNAANAHQTLHERLLISYAWFYFEVIYKSLVLERERQMSSKGRFEDDEHLAEFLKHFESLLGTIVSILTKHRTVGLTSVKHLIHNLALFFNDLYSVLEKDRVVLLLQNFLLAFRKHMDYNDPVLVEMLFTFYHIILDFEWGVDVMEVETIQPSAAVKGGAAAASAASAAAASEGKESPELLDRIKSKYPLISLFIVDYITHLSSMRESLIRENIINSLRMFLTKHDWDQRWQSNKPDLATMFLPLLPGLMEELDMLRTQAEKDAANAAGESSTTSASGSTEKATTAANTPLSPTGASVATGPSAEESKLRRNILICVLWILKNVPLQLLREWWNHDLLECAGARAAGAAAAGGEDGEPAPHSEAPHLEFMSLLDYCITSFPYAGIQKREHDTEYDSILSPESIAAFMGEGAGLGPAGGGVNDIKSDIEALMSNIHKTRTLGGGGTLRSARGSTINNERNATLGPGGLTGGGGGKSTLRQLRAQLANKPQTIGPGGLNMQALANSGMGLAPGMGDSIAGQGTIGRNAGVSFSSTTLPGSGNTLGASGTYRSKTFGNTATLTQSSREHLIKLVKWEGYLTRAVSSIVVRLLSEYLEDFHVFITERRNWLEDESSVEANCFESFHSVIRVFTSLVGSNQSTGTLLQLFPTMLLFLQRYGAWFHLNPTIKRAVGHFTSTAFRVCAFASREVRCHAVALMYSLLSINYALDGNVYNLQMQLTISLSKLTENLSMASEKYLQCSIQALMRTAAQALAKGTGVAAAGAGAVPQESLADFKAKVDTLLQRLSTILSDSMEIARQAKLPDSDTATSESLLVQIADAFSHIPEIRIEWLNRLAQHHQRHEQFAEAGQCYIQMASLVLQPAAKSASSSGTGGAAGADLGEGGFAVEKTSAELDRLIMGYYEHACKMLDKAELYEQASDVYKLLQPIYHKYRDYKSLSVSHQHLHQMFEKLMEALKKQSRMLGTYYRIGFYGLKFGDRLHGQEFIYKLPKITRIMEVTSRMKSLYSAQLGVPVRVLPDSNPVDMSKLDMEECVMQITFVNPYFPVDTGAAPSEFEKSIDLRFTPRTHWIEQNTGLQAFKFSTPFTTGGKTFGSTAEQHKRNTVLYVRAEFPYILTAQSVVKRQETILSPILSATEDVNLRTNSLLELLSSETLNAKVLTGLLAGSVATQVHGGSKEICQAFLTPQPADDAAGTDAHTAGAAATPADLAAAAAAAVSSSEPHPTSIWSDADQSKLKVAMRKFLDACVLGLEANKKLAVTESEKEFQLNLETQFVDLTGFIHPLIRESKIKKKGVKKGVRFG